MSGSAEAPPHEVKVFHVHTAIPDQEPPTGTELPVYPSSGRNQGAGQESGEAELKYVSFNTELGFKPGMTTCPTCQQQVETDVTYKAGRYAWIVLAIILCLGLVTCLASWLLSPMILHKKFKDAHHTCPRCNSVLHIEKRQCCE